METGSLADLSTLEIMKCKYVRKQQIIIYLIYRQQKKYNI